MVSSRRPGPGMAAALPVTVVLTSGSPSMAAVLLSTLATSVVGFPPAGWASLLTGVASWAYRREQTRRFT